MNNPLRFFSAMTLGIVAVLSCRAQQTVSAPAALPTPCIIRYESPGSQIYSKIIRTVIYNTDGIYSEWARSFSHSGSSITLPSQFGRFTYSVDPKNPDHASIVYPAGINAVPTDDLYFVSTTTGSYDEPPSAHVPYEAPSIFTLYPAQASSGGVNLSTRTTLTDGGHAIVGFVIGGTVPRWVLLRAVGPTLSRFGVTSTVTSPSFTLWNAKGEQLGASYVWNADPNLMSSYVDARGLVGAFSLIGEGATPDNTGYRPPPPANEGVLLLPLKPGAYTMVLSGKSAGNILGEVYFLPF